MESKAGKPVEVEVDISDKTVERVINKLWGYAKYNYVPAVYGTEKLSLSMTFLFIMRRTIMPF